MLFEFSPSNLLIVADKLEQLSESVSELYPWERDTLLAACAMLRSGSELRRLHANAEESEALRERLSALLTSTAIALRGPAPELVSWSWHDLPERAAALVAQRDALLKALHNISLASQDSGSTREGMGLDARAAIKAVEGEKA